MTRTKRIAAAAIAALAVGPLAAGAAETGSAGGVGAALQSPCAADEAGPPGARMFGKFDPDGDGRVTLAEFVGHRSQRFRSLDADGDGRVTREEFDARHPDQTPERTQAVFRRFDADGDGVITKDEWDAGETARFQRIDADRDGIVTRGEFLADRRRVCAERLGAGELPPP